MAEKKGVANFERQTWDREVYEQRAQLRASGQLPEPEEKKVIRSSKEEFKAADDGAQGPAGSARAFLKARTQRVALDGSVGTVRVVKSDELAKSGGYYCEVCECGLKDSVAYLDHINGKKHLRKLGYSMRVERSTVEQVKSRLQSAAKRKWDPVMTKKLDAMEEYEKKIKAVEEEEARAKKQRRDEKRAKKLSSGDHASADDDHHNDTESKPVESEAAEAVEAPVDAADAEMMAMMGFSGFGGSKK